MIQNKSIPCAMLFALFALFAAFPLHAEDDATERMVTAQVELLGHDDFKVRNKATDDLRLMLKKDHKAVAHLQQLKDHEDPEIRDRVEQLLRTVEAPKAVPKAAKKAAQNDEFTALKWIDPAGEKKARSIDKAKSKHELKLRIVNQTKQPIKIHFICAHAHKKEGGGNRKNHAQLKAGATHNCKKTWEKRYYVITDMNDKALGLYLTGEQNGKIIFTGVPKAK